MSFLYLYLLSVPIFAVLDLLWRGLIARAFYHERLRFLLKPINWVAAFSLYLIFLFGLTFFATGPAYAGGSFWYAMALGGLYGFFAYSTYSLANQTSIRTWPLSLTIVDIVWGTLLSAAVATLTYTLGTALL